MTKIRLSQDDVLIVGAGLAGLLTALHLAPRPVTILTAGALGTLSSSAWAQGGVAAAVGPDDSTELHIADTLAAGAGLCDPEAVRRIVEAGPKPVHGPALQPGFGRFGADPDRRAGAYHIAADPDCPSAARRYSRAGSADAAWSRLAHAAPAGPRRPGARLD